MEQLIVALKDSLNILLGALAALFGAIVQVRLSERRERERLKTEKLERAYHLCQAIYDGHKREITNAKRQLPNNPADYLHHRKHPGSEMSELKMLIRSYASRLSPSLTSIDNGHEPLKNSFIELDELILKNQLPGSPVLQQLFLQWDDYLKNLSRGSREIKGGIEELLRELVEYKPWWQRF